MPEYKDWSLDHLEAEYRSSLDEYERDAAKMRARVLDLKRARDRELEALPLDDRIAWERSHMPDDAPEASRADES
jgi:hypothetical protein